VDRETEGAGIEHDRLDVTLCQIIHHFNHDFPGEASTLVIGIGNYRADPGQTFRIDEGDSGGDDSTINSQAERAFTPPTDELLPGGRAVRPADTIGDAGAGFGIGGSDAA